MKVECLDCGWKQDDFWTIESHPLNETFLSSLVSDLEFCLPLPEEQRRKEISFQDFFPTQPRIGGYFEKIQEESKYNLDTVTYLISEMRKVQSKMGNMKWITEFDFDNDNEKKCPKCDSSNMSKITS